MKQLLILVAALSFSNVQAQKDPQAKALLDQMGAKVK
jgi:hypothetical protein